MEIYLSQPYSFYQLGQRGNQEDARFPDEDRPQDFKPAFVVCDGVGGEEHGEIASSIIAASIGENMQHYDLSEYFGTADFRHVMAKAVEALDEAAKSVGKDMGTTMTFVCFHSGGAFMAYIGDSRIYHVRPDVGILFQSDDHSLVNALVHSGNLTPQEAVNHPQSNIITRCIQPFMSGHNLKISIVQTADIMPGDYFLLCSDGVLHNISDKGIFELLSKDISDLEKINILARDCASSSDNNTAYLVRVENVERNEDTTEPDDVEGIEEPDLEPGSTTRAIDNQDDGITEICVEKKESLASKVSDFFNKIFS